MTPRQTFVEAMKGMYADSAQLHEADDLVTQGRIRAACEAWVDMVCSNADWSADCVKYSNTRAESKLRHKNECVPAILKEVFDA